MRRLRFLAPLAVPLCLLTAACGAGGPDEPPATGVVLITADTLRADALSVYDPGAPATPAIADLADRGTLFERAVSPMPVTKPTHFSLFTGRHPREHGVVNNQLALPEEETTLAEVFRREGFRTAGFSGVRFFGPRSGGGQGFEEYAAPVRPEIPAEQVVGRALRWLQGVGDGERFFLWVHLFDPHIPYEPPRQYFSSEPPTTPSIRFRATWHGLRAAAELHGGDVPEADYRRARALYEGEVRYVDDQVGRLVAALRQRGDAGDVVVAFTADHGECFEKGVYFRHAHCPYEGAIRVPLILSRAAAEPGAEPGGGPERISRQVEIVHLPAALLQMAGLPVPESFRRGGLLESGGPGGGEEPIAFFQPVFADAQTTEGRNSHWRGIESVAGDPARQALPGRGEAVGLSTERWWYVLGGFEAEELYDRHAASGEERNLAEEERRTARRLRSEARRFLEEVELTVLDPQALSPELRESLRALGYL